MFVDRCLGCQAYSRAMLTALRWFDQMKPAVRDPRQDGVPGTILNLSFKTKNLANNVTALRRAGCTWRGRWGCERQLGEGEAPPPLPTHGAQPANESTGSLRDHVWDPRHSTSRSVVLHTSSSHC